MICLCSCGKYEDCAATLEAASDKARLHVMLGPEHEVTIYDKGDKVVSVLNIDRKEVS